jgi:hypothetical protein
MRRRITLPSRWSVLRGIGAAETLIKMEESGRSEKGKGK